MLALIFQLGKKKEKINKENQTKPHQNIKY